MAVQVSVNSSSTGMVKTSNNFLSLSNDAGTIGIGAVGTLMDVTRNTIPTKVEGHWGHQGGVQVQL